MEEKQMIKQTKYGWVDLSNVSKRGKLFDWRNSVGKTIKFLYKDICSYMVITKYIDRCHIAVTIPDYFDDYVILIEDIVIGKLARAVGQIIPEFRYKAGDIVNDTILILSAYKNGRRKYYNYKCLIDGYEWHISEDDLKRGRRCPVCSNQKVVEGINDIATTSPNIALLFLNASDTHKYTQYSTKKVDFVCPRCGGIINRPIYVVTEYGLSCKRCSDGISYPEKFVYNLLRQIDYVDFGTQQIFDWSKNIYHSNKKLSGNKIYDFYIQSENPVVIEVHGEQHFRQCLYHLYKNSKSLEEEQENDRLKMNIAIDNGILPDCYIQLDCCESNLEYIKQSIMNSNLPHLLKFTEEQIDWDRCNRFATSSRIFEVCALWNSGMHLTKEIGIQTKLDQSTVLKYLRRGEELGIIQDPPKHIKKNTQQNN